MPSAKVTNFFVFIKLTDESRIPQGLSLSLEREKKRKIDVDETSFYDLYEKYINFDYNHNFPRNHFKSIKTIFS